MFRKNGLQFVPETPLGSRAPSAPPSAEPEARSGSNSRNAARAKDVIMFKCTESKLLSWGRFLIAFYLCGARVQRRRAREKCPQR